MERDYTQKTNLLNLNKGEVFVYEAQNGVKTNCIVLFKEFGFLDAKCTVHYLELDTMIVTKLRASELTFVLPVECNSLTINN